MTDAHIVDDFLEWLERDGNHIECHFSSTGEPAYFYAGGDLKLTDLEGLAFDWFAAMHVWTTDYAILMLAITTLKKVREGAFAS